MAKTKDKKKKTYRVTWEIDVEATSPEEAAKMGYKIMKRARKDAPYYDVSDGRKKYDIDITRFEQVKQEKNTSVRRHGMGKKKPEIEIHGNVYVMKFDGETDMNAVNEVMHEINKRTSEYINDLAEELNIKEDDAMKIWYLRTRSRWTQEKEDGLIKMAKEGKILPNVFAGEDND